MKPIATLATLWALGLGITGNAQALTGPVIYSSEALDSLRFMIEEEKLAGDVYRAFGVLYPEVMPFKNIPKSEDTHFATLVAQAEGAGLDVSDLTSLGAATFLNPDLQTLYGQLVAKGSTSRYAALTVGRDIELLDIDDLTAAQALVPADSSLYAAYGNLRSASYKHLNAFNTWLAMTPAPVPEPETYALLLAGLGLVGVMARLQQS
ncbi:MAG: DUF2202 domain-containing protein [Pseudomonadota bacterium]